jgi:hypothetical protein
MNDEKKPFSRPGSEISDKPVESDKGAVPRKEAQESQTVLTKYPCEYPFDKLLGKDTQRVISYNDAGYGTLVSHESDKWLHAVVPEAMQNLIIEALTRNHRVSVNHILQRGIIEGYYIFNKFISSQCAVDYNAVGERIEKGDMALSEGLRAYRCDITIDGLIPKQHRMSFTLNSKDAETIGSHADNIKIDRQTFHLVLFCYALRTYTGLAPIYESRCNVIIDRFEKKYRERAEDLNRRLSKPPRYDSI